LRVERRRLARRLGRVGSLVSRTLNAWGWSPDGARLIFTCLDEQTVRIWDVAAGQGTVDEVHADAARFLELHSWWPMAIAVGDDGYVHAFELVGVQYRSAARPLNPPAPGR
jgi:sugar lactone lactonase YvrE